jgi:hypothetical protein
VSLLREPQIQNKKTFQKEMKRPVQIRADGTGFRSIKVHEEID